jgi:uncharacterized protein (DUF849 family)
MSKLIITVACTGGVHTPTMSPYLPITPEQIADDAVRAHEAGAAIAHIHVRDPQTGKPSTDPELFRQVLTRIKSRCNMIVNTTTGGGIGFTTQDRLRTVTTFKPELASFNAGSINFALYDIPQRMGIKEWKYDWEAPYLNQTRDYIFPNTFKTLEEFAQVFRECQTKPELEIYDTAMINNVAYLVERGFLDKPVYLQFVMGIMGSLPATVEELAHLHQTAQRAFGNDYFWSVIGGGRAQMRLGAVAMTMGGNVRVGMEDSLFVGKGVLAKSSADQVEKLVRIAKELDVQIASPDEARGILGLKGSTNVNF